jgi:membrane glycosyltransferase
MAISMEPSLATDHPRPIRLHPTSVPPPAPIDMPTQDLRATPAARTPRRSDLRTHAARLVTFGGALAMTAAATHQMFEAVAVGEITGLQAVLVVLFAITFGWIALAATTGIAGLLPARRRDHAATPGFGVTCLAMPVYNEDAASTTSALLAMGNDIARLGEAERFEIFILSDTTDPDAWARETAAVARLRASLGPTLAVWYRHRPENLDRKSGNLREFIERWGGRYEALVILDADSLMTGETLIALRDRLAGDPEAGLIQTVPVLVEGETVFARMQQFAGAIAGPVVANGLAAWQGDDGNYWGHNAILRTRAFAESCGLPHLKGRRPFGGMIMSHDFVEAALLRRAGWKVLLARDLGGSWERPPPTLSDTAVRDRRWTQGNLQHLAVIGTPRLAWPSRLHFAMGVMSYLASPLWLLLIGVGLALVAQASILKPKYFTEAFQLFPTWPIFDSERMLWIFGLTLAALLLPKIIGLVRELTVHFVQGSWRTLALTVPSWLLEILLSGLVAPIMMLIQSRHVWDILRGRDSGWMPQRREAGTPRLMDALSGYSGHTIFGVIVLAAMLFISPKVVAWLSPILGGWLLAVPLSWAVGDPRIGRWVRRTGVFATPEEVAPPDLLIDARDARLAARSALEGLTIESLLDDRLAADRHFDHAGQSRQRLLGAPDIPSLTLAAKIAEATSRAQAVGWLDKAEKMALLKDRGLFDRMAALKP